jgi:hypothetical protein
MGKPLEPLEIRNALIDAIGRERREKLIFSDVDRRYGLIPDGDRFIGISEWTVA